MRVVANVFIYPIELIAKLGLLILLYLLLLRLYTSLEFIKHYIIRRRVVSCNS